MEEEEEAWVPAWRLDVLPLGEGPAGREESGGRTD